MHQCDNKEAGASVATIGGRGIIPTSKENNNVTHKGDYNSSGSAMDAKGMSKILPKVKLIAFNGKKPRAWLRKCTKYFEMYGVPEEGNSKFILDRKS